MPDCIVIPPSFARRTVEREGAAGRAWLDAVPDLVTRLTATWRIALQSTPMAGEVGLVWEAVRSDDSVAVLKVGWQDEESRNEGAALRVWAGKGATRLLESDAASGSLLLERLHPHRSLEAEPLDAALRTAAEVLAALHVPPPGGFSGVLVHRGGGEANGRYEVERERLLPAVTDAVAGKPAVLLHGDLHYGNVLFSDSGWKAIDPKPAVGPAEWEYLPLLRNRFDEYNDADLLRDIRRRLDRLIELTGAGRREAQLFARFRSLADAAYARRLGDGRFERSANAIIAAMTPP